MACGNAAGQMLAPNVIFKGKTAASLQCVDSNRAPPGTTVSVSESGWTKQGIATLWFKKSFLPAIGRVRPQVLISDGHNSHNFLELVELARENNIKLVELPEHTSHWLQPLDRMCFKMLKSLWNGLCQNFSNQDPGQIINKKAFLPSTTTVATVIADVIADRTPSSDVLLLGSNKTNDLFEYCSSIALKAMESAISSEMKKKFEERYTEGCDFTNDALY
ncbi:uncharacterized protein LOC141900814 [Tubulanus polymorphus]|uniref:uncharacterized protein LOC141900814 n=1 Tax=Tubulanus polymorphus TaxID=672921 RepID=UPI003DA5184D